MDCLGDLADRKPAVFHPRGSQRGQLFFTVLLVVEDRRDLHASLIGSCQRFEIRRQRNRGRAARELALAAIQDRRFGCFDCCVCEAFGAGLDRMRNDEEFDAGAMEIVVHPEVAVDHHVTVGDEIAIHHQVAVHDNVGVEDRRIGATHGAVDVQAIGGREGAKREIAGYRRVAAAGIAPAARPEAANVQRHRRQHTRCVNAKHRFREIAILIQPEPRAIVPDERRPGRQWAWSAGTDFVEGDIAGHFELRHGRRRADADIRRLVDVERLGLVRFSEVHRHDDIAALAARSVC